MILVTGGAGYIGSHCVLGLLETGRNVVIFDSLETGHIETVETLQHIAEKNSAKLEFIKGTLQRYEDIKSVFSNYEIDSVLHFGAYSLVEESIKEPQKYYFNNVYGSLNLFRVMIENNVKKIVFSSSAATYGEPEYSPIDEAHSQTPINPYGKTKFMIEQILDDYSQAYNLRSVCLRYFNVAGADNEARIGEWHEPETHLIPNILKSTFESGKVFKIFGTDYNTPDGTCVRDYINIEDLVNAHLLSLNYLDNGGKTDFFNLGTTDGNSVKQIFALCEAVIELKIDVEQKERRQGDPAILVADNKKAKNILGWTPKNSIKTSIETAYNWEAKLNKSLKK